jgi:hypothetical protein
MAHDEPSLLFSVLAGILEPLFFGIGLFFILKVLTSSLKESMSETNSVLREILTELKKLPKSGADSDQQ